MRCNNCGWDNPVGARYCEKCNQPLEFSSFQPINSDYNPRATMVDAQQIPNPRATMVDAQQIPNPRATMVDAQQIPNPRATMVDAQQIPNPRATMVDAQQIPNPRATMVDAQQMPNPRATMVDTSSPQRDVVLCCMDDLNIGQITISSAIDLGLVSGDVILIKNLRYQVK